MRKEATAKFVAGYKNLAREYERYLSSNAYELSDVYTRYSHAKRIAYFRIHWYMEDIGGYDLRIVSFNTQKFTVGFRVRYNGKEYFIYETPMYRYIWEIER